MGDQGGGAAAPPGGVLPSGLLPNVAAGFTRALDMDRWMKAEERTDELIARIQPTWPSEERRNAVASYVQRLITKCFSCKVFTFGSVPLKTYLPDGDIDLTAFSENENLKDTWANEVRDALESEEKNENAEFRVKEVQYIQAEVKLIKCLVEDIVVDISFSQVGGLCTLCFLDEIDILINRNHLFKRSIILIKAWCYYESRILGAHHGLISTYALETLVLYTFHVYNNCFAGPLEVLYRFLEFFSNFDWENFCVSLWGPVPIRSLPDIIVEPPRKDGGELLLSKLFLDACSTLYAVLPAGQESSVQTFVPKHFNVIDPLRISNNLGRSVSKGNFFRIRSAFTFGAKRLARLFECPKENLVTEVNQFFTNTWGRHQSGNRPDAPSQNLLHLRPMEGIPADESTNAKSTSSFERKNENNILLAGHDYEADAGLGGTSQVLKMVNQHFQSIYKRSIPSALYHAQYQRSYGSQIDPEISDNVDRNISAKDFAQSHINQNSFWHDHSLNIHEGQNLFQIARGHSSPELNDASPEVLAQVSYNKIQAGKNQFPPAILNHGNRRNHVGIDDPSASRHLPHQNLEVADSNGASNSYLDHAEELTSVSETLEMHQEEQDLVNMMASTGLHNGQLQFPIHFPSHVPFPMAHSLVPSMAYNHRNMAGVIPPNIAVIDPSWGSNVQYPQGFVPSPILHYSSTAGQNLNKDDMIGPVNGSSGMVGINPGDVDQDVWPEDDVGSNRSDSDNVGFQIFPSDDKKQLRGRPNVVSSPQSSNSSASSVRGHHKVARENGGQLNENDTVLQHHSSKGNDTHSTVGTGNVGSFPSSKATSLRNKPVSESSSDGSEKAAKSARDKQGRRLAASAIRTALYGNSRNVRQLEGSSDHSSVQADDEASPHARNPQLPASDPADLTGSGSMIQIKPMPVSSSQHRTVENSGVIPFTFYPTGPPVPFLAMLPFYNIPSGASGSDGSASQFDNEQRLDHIVRNPSGQSYDLAESQLEIQATSNFFRNSTHELADEHTSDILKSDFTSHWQNLQYGRYCQNIRNQGPFMYPPPVVVPPGYLQGQFPWDGPGRPPANMNVFTQFPGYGPRMVPTAPLQPGLQRNSVFQHYRDEVPRYRGGTGTYLPNPKVPFRERSSSSTRNQRGNYNHDRNDTDREGNWSNAKYRAAGRGHGRAQAEKPDSRPDRSSTNDIRTDRRWNSHRHESSDSYQALTSSFGSRKPSHGSTNMAYGMYTMPAVNSNGGNDTAEPSDGSSAREGYQQRHGTYRGSSHSSPG